MGPLIPWIEAKRTLGYGPDVLLLLTIATPFKYCAPGETVLLDLVRPVLNEFPNAVLMAIEAKSSGDLAAAHIATNEPIVACGKRWDTDIYYAAADVYLDSVPFSSITSLLEAGSRGVPLLGYQKGILELELLGPGAPGLETAMEVAHDLDSYRTLLRRFISDGEFRQQCGNRVNTNTILPHGGKLDSAVRDVYEKGEQNHERGCLMTNKDIFDTTALNVALVRLYGESRSSYANLSDNMLEYYPIDAGVPLLGISIGGDSNFAS